MFVLNHSLLYDPGYFKYVRELDLLKMIFLYIRGGNNEHSKYGLATGEWWLADKQDLWIVASLWYIEGLFEN